MSTSRLETFSDGVIAVIITIMVLQLRVPSGPAFSSLKGTLPHFLFYVLSFATIAIYWNNHHHLLRSADRVSARLMWANLHLLFWLSLIPFATQWLGENHDGAWPTATYGAVLLLSGCAYQVLQLVIVSSRGKESALARALGSDWKGKLSLGGYAAAVGFAFLFYWMSDALYVLVALAWLIPDRRIEQMVLSSGT